MVKEDSRQIVALIVAEDELIRLALRSILRSHWVIRRTIEASSHRDALRLCASAEFSLAIVDLTGAEAGDDAFAMLRELSMLRPDSMFIAYADDCRRFCDESHRRQFVCACCERGSDSARRLYQLIDSAFPAKASDVAAAQADGAAERIDRLTAKEREILGLVGDGESSRDIAAWLGVSLRTVESHRARICAKLAVRSVADLTKAAVAAGLTSLSITDRRTVAPAQAAADQ